MEQLGHFGQGISLRRMVLQRQIWDQTVHRLKQGAGTLKTKDTESDQDLRTGKAEHGSTLYKS